MHYRELADDFEARYPGTKVEYDVRLDIEYRSDLLLMLGSEAPPDIFLTYGGGHLRSLVEAGFARDLTEEMAAGWALTYKPGALTNLIIGERIFAVPMRMTLVSLWGNRRLLDEAGVDPGDLDTWEGLLEGVERLRAAGINPLALGAADGWPVGLYWGGFAQGLGGREALDRALAGRDGGFAAAPFVEAGRRLAELAVRDAFQRTYPERSESEANGTFTDGHAAMTLNGDWLITRAMRTWPGGADRAAADLVRIPFPPEAAAEEPATYGGVDGWVVRAGAPERAVDFLRELAGLESQRRIAELGLGIPAIAGADTAIADPLLREVASELTRSRYHQLYFDQLLGPLAGEALNAAAVMVVRGEIGPDEAAAEIEASWAEVREAWGVGAVPEPEREPELVPAE